MTPGGVEGDDTRVWPRVRSPLTNGAFFPSFLREKRVVNRVVRFCACASRRQRAEPGHCGEVFWSAEHA